MCFLVVYQIEPVALLRPKLKQVELKTRPKNLNMPTPTQGLQYSLHPKINPLCHYIFPLYFVLSTMTILRRVIPYGVGLALHNHVEPTLSCGGGAPSHQI